MFKMSSKFYLTKFATCDSCGKTNGAAIKTDIINDKTTYKFSLILCEKCWKSLIDRR